MARAPEEWGFWFPEDGDTAEDVVPIIGRIFDATDAAVEACNYDFNSRDGWERGDAEFEAIIVSPEGEQTAFILRHEPSVEHLARRK